MSPSSTDGFGGGTDVLNSLAVGLAADSTMAGLKTLAVIRVRSPDLVLLGEDTGEDLLASSSRFIDMLLMSLRSDV